MDSPFAIQSNTSLHLSDADRLHTDTVGQLKKAVCPACSHASLPATSCLRSLLLSRAPQRQSQIEKHDAKVEHKRERAQARTQMLQQRDADAKQAEEERVARFRARGLKAKRNTERYWGPKVLRVRCSAHTAVRFVQRAL